MSEDSKPNYTPEQLADLEEYRRSVENDEYADDVCCWAGDKPMSSRDFLREMENGTELGRFCITHFSERSERQFYLEELIELLRSHLANLSENQQTL